jgi:hypothetical protein
MGAPDFLAAYAPPPSIPVLKKWSYSAWSLYKDVPYMLYAQEVLGIKREAGAAADRGTQLHATLEQYLLDGAGDPHPVGKGVIDTMRDEGYVLLPERKFMLDADWKETEKDSRKLTAIMDVWGQTPDGRVKIVDWKTGKKYPLKHTQQGRLYAAVAAQVCGIEECIVEFVYLDGGKSLVLDLDKHHVDAAVRYWREEGDNLLSLGMDAFAPPEDLQGLAPWYKEFLSNKNNYDPDHFSAPWYAK